MALIQCNFFSTSLMRIVPIQVILPTDKQPMPGAAPEDEHPFPTLYLLHGIMGNDTDWVSGTRIQRWAQDLGIAVVMPSGDNHFYVDNRISGELYGTFTHTELVEFTRKTFPLSRKREDTFIGGLSMGGYGAIINGLTKPDTFGAICALSSALVLEKAGSMTEYTDFIMTNRGYYESVFGDLTRLTGSDKDYQALAKSVSESGAAIPRIYMACGTEDGLFEANLAYKAHLLSLGYDLTWVAAPGVHDWYFWDTYILEALKWLLPENAKAVPGMHSGNVPDTAGPSAK